VRGNNEGDGRGEAAVDGQLECRGGLLRQPEQRSGRDAASIEFLIAFVQNLIRNNPSSDVLQLSLMAAAKEVGITKEQATQFAMAIVEEQKRSPWPEGFFA
jgi:hypothetical protein